MLNLSDFQVALEAMHEGVMIVDKDYVIQFYNSAMAKIDGYSTEEVLGKNYLEIFPKQTYENSTIFQAFNEKRKTINKVQTYVTGKGRRNSLITSTIPIIENNQVIAVIETCKDISVERKLFDDIIEMQNVLNKKGSEESGRCAYHFDDIVGVSPKLIEAIQRAERAAKTSSFVLISGETGTGKEIFAQSIHNYSGRKSKPFVAVNCAALPSELLEGILFGTTRGGFTGSIDRAGLFEEANHGTMLLDEIDSMDTLLQGKLLRVIQEGNVRRIGGTKDIQLDVRIISTTSTGMENAIKEKRFRNDLFYRLSVVDITIPPLRERGQDILDIKDYYINKFNKEFNKNVVGISQDVKSIFMSYYWPGNVRELRHCIEGAMNIIGDDDVIRKSHLPTSILNKVKSGQVETETIVPEIKTDSKKYTNETKSLRSVTDNIEKKMIIEALEICKGNVSKVADFLGMKRQTLQYKMNKYGIIKDNITIHYLEE
ncbi:MAG: sigma-54 interaction domain-containing protein [Aminipila sp.]